MRSSTQVAIGQESVQANTVAKHPTWSMMHLHQATMILTMGTKLMAMTSNMRKKAMAIPNGPILSRPR